MKPFTTVPPDSSSRRRAWSTFFRTTLVLLLPSMAAAQSGSLSGSVSNAATNRYLRDALVEIPEVGRSVVTDSNGRYVISNLPAGVHEIVATYLGLDDLRTSVTVIAGQDVVQNFNLTSSIYTLEQFKVTGQREGEAASIVARRNAPNAKNVISTDVLTNIPNMGAGELAIELPGVTGLFNDAGGVSGAIVRGTAGALNQVTMDGNLLPGTGGFGRGFRLDYTNGATFEQVEVIKGHTPDRPADSLGGTINLVTRSPLNMKEKRRVSYRVAGMWAPTLTRQIPLREDHSVHPLTSLNYQEVFDLLGGERNFGVTVNAFYSENVGGAFSTTRDFENTTANPAYVWDYRTQDLLVNSMQHSINTKFEYRPAPSTSFTLNLLYNNTASSPFQRHETAATTTQSVGTSGTAGVLPGYTDLVTQVRAAPGSVIQQTSVKSNQPVRMRQADFGFKHSVGRFNFEGNVAAAQTHFADYFTRLINQITNVGWRLDRSYSDLFPRFTQTEGLDFTDPANFRPVPTSGLFADREYRLSEIYEVRGHASYKISTRVPTSVKVGFSRRGQRVKTSEHDFRWDYLGSTALPYDPSIVTLESRETGRRIPQWDAASVFDHEFGLVNPRLWKEDIYFSEVSRFTNTRVGHEFVTTWFGMMEGKFGDAGWRSRTGYLGGVRVEQTDTSGRGYVRSRTLSTAAEQAADGVAAARRDYAGNLRELKGSYTEPFPSVHLTHAITPKLKALVSWSTSFGRPAMTNFLPNESFSDTNRTLTVPNPSLKPQIANNWDASLDYYFEPVGTISVSWFHKKIENYILSGIQSGIVPTGANNGYNGEYGGYTILSTANGGTGTVNGWELAYQQQLTFLPGLLRGLGVSANATFLKTEGDFGGTSIRTGGQIPNFIPRTGTLRVTWRNGAFTTQASMNHQSSFISSYSAIGSSRNLYRYRRTVFSAGAAYAVTPNLSVTCDVNNAFNEPQGFYRGFESRMQSKNFPGVRLTAGLSGRF